MVDNNNVFYSKTHEELILLFEQFLESEKTGSIPDNELGKIRDEYCERYRPNGILMLITDLTRVLAELWYERQQMNFDFYWEVNNILYHLSIDKNLKKLTPRVPECAVSMYEDTVTKKSLFFRLDRRMFIFSSGYTKKIFCLCSR